VTARHLPNGCFLTGRGGQSEREREGMETTIVREVSVNYRGGGRLGERLRQLEEVAASFRRTLPDNSREHVMALYLNGAHKVIAYSGVPTGTAISAPVHPREVYQPAMLVGATAVTLGHNHPSGSTEPSAEDHKVTRSLKAAAEVLGLKLLDHLVISDCDCFSFLSNGALWGLVDDCFLPPVGSCSDVLRVSW
jgi:DNA repair protein RadC